MIPAILAAAKAATWAQRGIVAGVIVGTLAAVFGWGYLKGYSSCEKNYDQTIIAQALDAKGHEAAKAEALDAVEERNDVKERQADQQTKVVTHEVIKYVEKTRPVTLDPEYQRLAERVRELQRDAENRVSQADAATAEVAELRAAQITTNQLLLAYTELANARGEDLKLIGFLKDWEKTRYAAEMAFYEGLPLEARDREN